jgi:hypothetical protein
MSTLNVANVTDGTTSVPTGYVVNGSVKYFSRTTGTFTGFIGDTLNASSLTDDGAGVVTISFTSNFNNSNYCISGMVLATSGKIVTSPEHTHSVGSTQFRVHNDAGADSDANITTSILGDLA